MTSELQIYCGDAWVLLCMSDNPRRMIVIDYEFGDFSYYADGSSFHLDLDEDDGWKSTHGKSLPCVAADLSYATAWNGTKLEPTTWVPKLFEEDRKFLDLTLSLEDMKAYPIRKYGIAHILGDSYTALPLPE